MLNCCFEPHFGAVTSEVGEATHIAGTEYSTIVPSLGLQLSTDWRICCFRINSTDMLRSLLQNRQQQVAELRLEDVGYAS